MKKLDSEEFLGENDNIIMVEVEKSYFCNESNNLKYSP